MGDRPPARPSGADGPGDQPGGDGAADRDREEQVDLTGREGAKGGERVHIIDRTTSTWLQVKHYRDRIDATTGTGRRLSIGEVADVAGVPITTLRYYERLGLIDPPPREGGKRRYGSEVLMRLMLIRFCRAAGLGLDEIADIVADDEPGRTRTKAIAAERIVAIDAQIAELALARDLMVATTACGCASPEDCGCGALDPVVDRLRAALDG